MHKIHSSLLKETYYTKTLPSGFRVILYPKSDIFNKGAYLSVGYGSLHERFVTAEGEHFQLPAGSAHFLEHKLFENDEVKIFEKMSLLGANVNAFTSQDNTCYYFTAPSRFDEALELLLQFPLFQAYTEEGIRSEREIISREIDMYLDSVEYRSFHRALSELYPHHPVGQDIAGSKTSILQIDQHTLSRIMEHFYVPENMFLFVIGDFMPSYLEEVIARLPAYYHTPKPRAIPVMHKDESVPKRKILREHSEVSTPSFDYVLKLAPIDDPVLAFRRYVKYSIILDVLFGKGSDFYERCYEQGVISDLDVSYQSGQDYRYIAFSAEGKKPFRFKMEVERLLRDFHEKGISSEDIERNKRKIMGRYLMGFNSINNIAHTFIAFHYQGAKLFDFLDIVHEIEIDDFQELFNGTAVFSLIAKEKK